LYYIDHYGAENLKEQEEKDEQDSDYVSDMSWRRWNRESGKKQKMKPERKQISR
jgi:hypothetical protein